MPTGQFRLAEHLSKGNKTHQAVNDYVSSVESTSQYEAVDKAFIKIWDIEDAERAFRLMPLAETCYAMTCWKALEGKMYFESRLMFGARPAPRIYSSQSLTTGPCIRRA